MSDYDLNLTEELMLLELAAGKAGAPRTRSELLSATLQHMDAAAKAGADPSLHRLVELGLIEKLPRTPRQRSARWRIHPAGRDAVGEILGNRPAQRGRTWKQKAARALAVRRFLGLASGAASTLVEQGALPVYFLAARLGEKFQPGMTLDSLARRSAATALGLSNDQPETLWRAVFQRALSGESMAAAPIPSDDQPEIGGRAEQDESPKANPKGEAESRVNHQSLSHLPFSGQIDRTAETAREGWFGPRKLFIHRAWEAWRATTGETADLPAFKARLLESLRAGDLGLARADFTAGMEATDLEQAETRYGDEVFHFINFAQDRHL